VWAALQSVEIPEFHPASTPDNIYDEMMVNVERMRSVARSFGVKKSHVYNSVVSKVMDTYSELLGDDIVDREWEDLVWVSCS
jgi:hypothetical protein